MKMKSHKFLDLYNAVHEHSGAHNTEQGVTETIECKSDLLGKFVHSTEIPSWVDPEKKEGWRG